MRLLSPTRWAVATLLVAATFQCLSQAELQLEAAPQAEAGWRSEFGLGVIVNPEFQGADDYRVLPVPYFDLRYVDSQGEKYFVNVPQGIGAWLLRQRSDDGARSLDVGVALAPGFANRDDDDLPGLEDFGPAVEARAYVRYGAGPWGLQASFSQAVASGHEGFYADLSAARRGRIGRTGFWSIGPTVRIGDGTYNDALYGVSAAETLTSSLPAYDAGSGIESVGLQGLLSVPVSKNWRWTGLIRGGRLLGDPADSPVVEDETQLFFITAFTRRF
ncbi:MAG: MipA/OmpV family protein [Pseudomonadota bacterium]